MIIDKSEIIENNEIAKGIWKMVFKSVEIANRYLAAGQFVSVLANDNWEHPIRRPMSIAEVKDDEISIIYKLFGAVTLSLADLKSNDYINVLGPIGNTFNVEHETFYPILIGGGIGLSPILNLSKYLKQKDIEASTIIGAKTANEHFLQHNPNENKFLCTDDGTKGIKGTVIDALNIVLGNIDNPKIFACGPEPMLHSIQKMLEEKSIPAQFSVESYMACGVGICQGCAINKKQNDGYYLVCKDGPVFEANEVRFD
ncbi:MAG: dihydroorotate dehydrogenase electron transfer subunit [Candidatus Marinimicrobia bacterium]|nr:dihydroorotate dehydrogenase electron transfer subunit [Candidatus Neomarinimicrobiota bacterium]